MGLRCLVRRLKNFIEEQFLVFLQILVSRAATGGKTAKTSFLPGFCGIENGCSSGGMPVVWRSCLAMQKSAVATLS